MRFFGLTVNDRKLTDILDEVRRGVAQILDIREEYEWQAGHLEQSTFQPLSMLERGNCAPEIDKSKKAYIHCAAGVRVLTAKPLLKQMGYREVIALPYRYRQLKAVGL